MIASYSAGSFELCQFAIPCLLEKLESQLEDCKKYMDLLNVPNRKYSINPLNLHINQRV